MSDYLKAIAKILHQHTPLDKLKTFEEIEITLREQIQEKITPEIAQFFFSEVSPIKTGRPRQIKTILGEVEITENQAKYFGLESPSHLSPKMAKNTLLICANESYQRTEEDLKELTGIKISHSTLQRLVKKQKIEWTDSKLGIQEAMIDGGKVRLRTEEKGKSCQCKDFKAVSLNSIQMGAFFLDNQSLIDWINSQRLMNPRKGRINVMGVLRYLDKKRWIEFVGKANSDNFYEVMKSFYKELINEWIEASNKGEDFFKKGARIVVILDNASFHKKAEILKKIEEEMPNLQLEFLTEYSPDYNLIELVWHSAKEYIANRFFTSIEELEFLLYRLLNEGQLIIKWNRKLKNKGNSVNVV